MGVIPLDAEVTTITIQNVLDSMSIVLEVIMGMFSNVINTVTGNPIIFVPVLFAILGGICVQYAIGLMPRDELEAEIRHSYLLVVRQNVTPKARRLEVLKMAQNEGITDDSERF